MAGYLSRDTYLQKLINSKDNNSVKVVTGPRRCGKSELIHYEVDFIATDGINKFYIQSAFSIPDEANREQELKSLKKIDDSFRKIIITGDDIEPYTDDNGFYYVGIFDFLISDGVIK